jgi:hypothetical protein
VGSSHFPPFVVSTFSVGPPLAHSVEPLRDSARLESKWRYKGMLKGFTDPRPPFVLTENSPTMWPVQRPCSALTCCFCLLSNHGSSLRLGHNGLPLPSGRALAPVRSIVMKYSAGMLGA